MNEAWRLWIFFGVLFGLTLLEWALPRRDPITGSRWRWFHNLALALLNSVVVRLLIPISLAAWASWLHTYHWGLFQQLRLPTYVQVLTTIVLFDLLIYGQHVLFHSVPWLWRLHRVHHADLGFDATTGIRFHTIEIGLSQLIKLAAITLLGPPALAVILFEVVLNAAAMFNHSNIALPQKLDRILRCVLVTPDMHRVHHSTESDEMHRNFGFNLPWWDWLFRTYLPQPKAGHEPMSIGLPGFRDASQTQPLVRLLLMPFKQVLRDADFAQHARETTSAQRDEGENATGPDGDRVN